MSLRYGQFSVEYVPTVFDNYTVPVMDGEHDTPWAFRYSWARRLRPLSTAFLSSNRRIFGVFFRRLAFIARQSLFHLFSGFPNCTLCAITCLFFLVGTQVDLRDDEEVLQKLAKNGKKPISQEEGMRLAAQLKSVKYIECSPRHGGDDICVRRSNSLCGLPAFCSS
uniref:Uncharacterized protein n=1 Tax=Ditylenchus dipsaci TaxID=166011 RepID=A0A915DJ92_9BILA